MGKKTIPLVQMEMLSSINSVEGFDPDAFAIEFSDLGSNETRKRIPVMIQMAWFRLKYPEGKITVSITRGNNCFEASARVYPSYKDPVECYLGEATASRGPDPTKPTVSPREWAQTAAIGIALRNAGFGLQFSVAGDELTTALPNEFDREEGSGEIPGSMNDAVGPEAAIQEPPVAHKELTPEEKFLQACAVLWPNRRFFGRSLGEVMQMDPAAINWLSNNKDYPEAAEAAKTMCEYAINQASA